MVGRVAPESPGPRQLCNHTTNMHATLKRFLMISAALAVALPVAHAGILDFFKQVFGSVSRQTN